MQGQSSPVQVKDPYTGSILMHVGSSCKHIGVYLDALSHQIIKVFCDSQSAVGILTLNWKDTSYRDVTRDIKKASTLLEQSGVHVEINWAPGHSSIAGNEEADKLAKEAAHEASLFTDDRKTTSISDIKAASQAYTLSQWQRRWDTTEVGRTYYNYRSKLNQTLTNRCSCGQVEDTEHYLLQCPLQDIHRDVMARNLGQKISLYHLDLQHLLGSESDSNIPRYQETVKWELAEYIRATGRFISPPKTPSSPWPLFAPFYKYNREKPYQRETINERSVCNRGRE